jgi:serine/threonine protein phosphatase PrpC
VHSSPREQGNEAMSDDTLNDDTPALPGTESPAAPVAEMPATEALVTETVEKETPAPESPSPETAVIEDVSEPVADETPPASEAPPVSPAESAPSLAAAEPAPPALPEGHPPEPPRPLMVGAYLRLEFEIQEVVARGMTNLYSVAGGEYGASTPHLIAERDAQENWPQIEFSSALFPKSERFTQEGRDYLVFDWDETTSLYDYRAPSNDADYLRCLSDLSEALAELEEHSLTAHFSRELLRADAGGALRFYGFPEATNETSPSSLEELARLSNFLLKKVFAEAVTMRLGDEYGALAMSDEVKAFARALDEGAFESAAQVAQTARALCPPEEVNVTAALLSDVGQERELNEDAGAILQLQRAAHLGKYDFEVYIVSDGMGGHEGGEVASDLTLTALQGALHARAAKINWRDNVQVRKALLDIIDEVNRTVVDLTETPAYRGKRAKPGATLVFAVRLGRRVFVGNVGDSRAYRWNEADGLQRISKDHSYVQSLIDQGELSEEDAWDHPDGSIITAHIGDPKLRLKDVFLRLFKPGDKLLLVSDGVVDMLRDHEIEVFLKEESAREIVRDLVDASNTAGGADNITAVCVVFGQ